jgi:hypothetical protein
MCNNSTLCILCTVCAVGGVDWCLYAARETCSCSGIFLFVDSASSQEHVLRIGREQLSLLVELVSAQKQFLSGGDGFVGDPTAAHRQGEDLIGDAVLCLVCTGA